MSTGRDASGAVLRRSQGVDSQPASQGQRGVEAPSEAPDATAIGSRDAAQFAYIWQLFGYAILDEAGTKIGSVARIWADTASGQLMFLGLTTGRLRRRTHVIPATSARFDDHDRTITMPYQAATIGRAPHHNTDVGLSSDLARKVQEHYDNN